MSNPHLSPMMKKPDRSVEFGNILDNFELHDDKNNALDFGKKKLVIISLNLSLETAIHLCLAFTILRRCPP